MHTKAYALLHPSVSLAKLRQGFHFFGIVSECKASGLKLMQHPHKIQAFVSDSLRPLAEFEAPGTPASDRESV